MRTTLLITLLLGFPAAAAEEAYLLIDAIALPETRKQPTWIGLQKGSRVVHVPTKKSVVAVEPGKYRVDHIDFHKSRALGMGTLITPFPDHVKFEARVGSIFFVGLLHIEPTKAEMTTAGQTIKVLPSKLLFEWACDSAPELLARLPIRFVGENNEIKETRVRCEPSQAEED